MPSCFIWDSTALMMAVPRIWVYMSTPPLVALYSWMAVASV
jgi:hypothetical protein